MNNIFLERNIIIGIKKKIRLNFGNFLKEDLKYIKFYY